MFSTRSAPESGCQNTGASIRGGAAGNAWQETGVEGPFSSSVDSGQLKTSHERAPSPTAESTGAAKLPRRPKNRGQAGPRLSGNARSRRSNAATSVTDRAGLPPEAPGHEPKPPPPPSPLRFASRGGRRCPAAGGHLLRASPR